MKSLLVVMSLVALGGCAVAPPGGYYTTAVPQGGDPHQWHVVSSQPVASTTVVSSDGYTSAPVYVDDQSSGYVTQQVYVPAPVYYQQPYYNYYPPVSIGLDFGWFGGGGWGGGRGRGWGGGGYHGGGGFHGGHR